MPSYKRWVDDRECTILVDPKTGNYIYNAGKLDRDVETNLDLFVEAYGIAFRVPLRPAGQNEINLVHWKGRPPMHA